MLVNLFWIGLKLYKNPVRSLRVVTRLIYNFNKMIGGKTLVRAFKIDRKYAWDIFNPSWPSAGFNAFFKRHLIEIEATKEEQQTLRRLIVAITKRCPLACEHCSEAASLYQKDILSLEEYSARIDAFVAQGVGQLVFSGGEPLSRFDDLVHLLERYQRKCDQWVYSSGFGLTLERAFALKEAGLNGMAISLDHYDPDAHNQFRGNSKSFYWVEQSIENCQKAGILVALNVCPSRELVDERGLEKLIEWAKSKQIPIINILEPRKVGNYQDKDVLLTETQLQHLWQLSEQYNFTKSLKAYPTVLFPAGFRKNQSCGGGKSYVFLDFDGELYPCPFCKLPMPKKAVDYSLCEAETFA
jgi:MoaA/NifB/PqqE/SkfB family radical SAM enzyme